MVVVQAICDLFLQILVSGLVPSFMASNLLDHVGLNMSCEMLIYVTFVHGLQNKHLQTH